MKVLSEDEEKMEKMRSSLRTTSLLGVLFTDLVFVAVWWIFMPGLPLWLPAIFVGTSLIIWAALVKSKIENFARPKKS